MFIKQNSPNKDYYNQEFLRNKKVWDQILIFITKLNISSLMLHTDHVILSNARLQNPYLNLYYSPNYLLDHVIILPKLEPGTQGKED